MSDKDKRLIKLTEMAMDMKDEDRACELIIKTCNEYLCDLRAAIFPAAPVEAPYIIATLEMLANAMRNRFPEACTAADDLRQLPIVLFQVPINGGTENDK